MTEVSEDSGGLGGSAEPREEDATATPTVPSSTSRGLTLTRTFLMAAGAVLAGVGVWKLLQSGLGNIAAALVWLGGGVVAHDGVLAPITIVSVFVGARALPSWLRAPAAVGLVVLGTITIVAVPVLGRFGARPDNPTLLDRNYVGGWLLLAAVVGVGVALAGWWRRKAALPTPEYGSQRPPI